jgi:hypothetical protein
LETKTMRVFALLGFFLLACSAAQADEAAQCRANGGTYLTGRVTGAPIFAHGHLRDGVELSHTHLRLQSDRDGQSTDVAIDNVFAAGYDAAGESVPAPLSRIREGERLELCGQPYASGVPGLDWVHTNCGAAPASHRPDGWLKILAANGAPGPNLESSWEYCRLWP